MNMLNRTIDVITVLNVIHGYYLHILICMTLNPFNLPVFPFTSQLKTCFSSLFLTLSRDIMVHSVIFLASC